MSDDVIKVVESYGKKVDSIERSTLIKLGKRWAIVKEKLYAIYIALAQRISDIMAKGKPIPTYTIYGIDLYRKLLDEIDDEMEGYSIYAEGIIGAAQEKSIALGIDGANESLLALGIEKNWPLVDIAAYSALIGMSITGMLISDLIKTSYSDMAKGIAGAIQNGILKGHSVNELAKEMMSAGDISLERASTIARTEINRAYGLATAEQLKASGIVKGYRRYCYKPTACLACLMVDGKFYQNADDFWDHPNGKCRIVPEVENGENPAPWKTGKEWFEEQRPVDQKRIMGKGLYELWKNGDVQLDEMVYMKDSGVWGKTPAIKSLSQLKH